MADQVWVLTLLPHYDRRIGRNRYPGPYAFELDAVEAGRREQQGLVRVLMREELQEYLPPSQKAVTSRETKPAFPTADKKDFSSFIHRRGHTSWYDVDGHDKAVNGKAKALKVAEGLHSGSR